MTEQTAWVFLSVGLVFVIEGLVPSISPQKWKEMLSKISNANEKKIRMFGLSSMFFGAIIIAVVHNFFRV